MTKKPPSLRAIQQVARKVISDSTIQEAFLDSILNPVPKPTALVWMEDPFALTNLTALTAPDWFPPWITLADADQSPGKWSEHVEGKYYCLDPSSVFAATPLFALSNSSERSLRIIDLCASPGGKSIMAARALTPEELVCNEVIGNRIPALLSNLKRCGLKGTLVTQADPSHLSATNPGWADIVLVDAPCSGQSLLAKAEQGLGCFSKPVINANVGRQRRILAEASKLLKSGGHILYSTCTFSKEENEGNVAWFLKNFPEFSEVLSGRMWPQDGLGAGSFFSWLKREGIEQHESENFDYSSTRHWIVHEQTDL